MAANRIPLFPLEVVLLPGAALPLHIFEPRYKLMIRECIDHRSPFGMVLARQDGIATVGCTALVDRVIKRYEDGRMDLISVGQTAFRIQEIHDEKPYFEGTVEMLPDDPQPPAAAVTAELRSLSDQCHLLLNGSPQSATETPAGDSLAYQIAAGLPVGLAMLQELLELRAEAERQTRLVEALKQLLPELARYQQMRSKASGNGHGLH